MTKVYVINGEKLINKDIYDKYYNAISIDRRLKADKYKVNNPKITCVLSEVLLRYALKECGIDFDKEEIIYNEYGKPYFKSNSIYYNVSHSGLNIALAISNGEVGIDIEATDEHNLNIAKRYFTSNEYEAIMNSDNKNDSFSKLWTLKEAILKYDGKGLSEKLDKYDFSQFLNDEAFKYNELLFFKTYDYYGYKISVCSNDFEIEYNIIDINDIL